MFETRGDPFPCGGRGVEGAEVVHRRKRSLTSVCQSGDPETILGVLHQLCCLVGMVAATVDLIPELPRIFHLQHIGCAQVDFGLGPPQLHLVVADVGALELRWSWWKWPR